MAAPNVRFPPIADIGRMSAFAAEPLASTHCGRPYCSYNSTMKLIAPVLLISSVGLAACQQPIPVSADQTYPPAQAPEPSVVEVETLAGEWRVAAIDGRSSEEPIGLALTGSDQQIWWEPRCAGMARTYRINGRQISFGSTYPPRPAGSPTPPVCAIGVPPRLGDVFRALDNSDRVRRTENNGILISGPSHSVTLFSQ